MIRFCHSQPVSTIIKKVMFGNGKYILARSDGFVKCYKRGWVYGDYKISAPFDMDGFPHRLPNGECKIFKYSIHYISARAFLPCKTGST